MIILSIEEFKNIVTAKDPRVLNALKELETDKESTRGFADIIADFRKLTKNSGITAAEMTSYVHETKKPRLRMSAEQRFKKIDELTKDLDLDVDKMIANKHQNH